MPRETRKKRYDSTVSSKDQLRSKYNKNQRNDTEDHSEVRVPSLSLCTCKL